MTNLTDATIRSLAAPAKGQQAYFDDALPGFGIRVSQGGTRTFFVFLGKGSSRNRHSIGRYGIITLAEARTEARRSLAQQTTPAWRNNNPGNLKMGPFAKACGAFSQDATGFAVFRTYAAGFAALELLVRDAATGKSDIYSPSMTILQFFETYSPVDDKNDPTSYAKEVAGKLGVDYQTFEIKNLV